MTDSTATWSAGAASSLRRRVLHALGWALVGRLLAQGTSWAVTLIVIRLLTPADYGLMALATTFIGLVAMVNEFGMGGALIQAAELTDDQIQRSYGLLIVIQIGFAAVLSLAAIPIGAFFNEPALAPILQVSSVQFIFLAFAIIPEALLMRRLEFRLKAIVDTIGQFVGSIVTLGLALMGYGVWALVWGVIAISAARTIGFVAVSGAYPRPRFSFEGMRGIVSFGGMITAERTLSFLYAQADTLILGKRFGGVTLGIYSVALQLASLPIDKLGPVLVQVAFPAFAHVQDSPTGATSYLLKAIRLVCLISFPTMFGLSAVAPWLVPVVLGPKWLDTTLPLELLACVMPLRFIALVLPAFLKGLGHARLSLMNAISAFALFPTAFFIASYWGILGMCAAWIAVYPVYFFVTIKLAVRVTPLAFSGILRAMAPFALMAAVMFGVVHLLGAVLPDTLGRPAQLVILIGAGALAYAGQVLVFARATLAELTSLFQRR